jgi:hypothetical protein
MAGLVGAMVSFAEGSELMHELAGVDVDAKQVERTAEALGHEIAADERRVVEPSLPTAPRSLAVPLRRDATCEPLSEGSTPSTSAADAETNGVACDVPEAPYRGQAARDWYVAYCGVVL